MSDKLEKRLQELGLNLNDLNPILAKDSNYQLQLHQDRLAVYQLVDKHYVFVDFNSKQLNYRSQSHLNAELVVKAVLGKSKQPLKIMDCTAGFGKDAYILSLTGCEIIAYEANSLMYALLKDGLNRSSIDNIHLQNMNALEHIKSCSCDVIYLDPMYPDNKKSAKNNKNMTFLQQFVGHQQQSALELFNQALQSDVKKIVLKRPIKAEFITNTKPTSQIIGKAARFDVYVLPNA